MTKCKERHREKEGEREMEGEREKDTVEAVEEGLRGRGR